MSAAWLPQPVMFDSGHTFDCEGFTPEQCQYYKHPWRNWYVADWSYALPTVALFMSVIGIFIIGYTLTQILSLSGKRVPSTLQRPVAAVRYLSYRGFYIKSLGWNSAPMGLLLLAALGSCYFFCMDLIPSPYYWPGSDMVWGNSPPLGTRSGWLALACMPFIFATASKTNWITLLTGITHEKLQIFHRWIAYAFLVLALMHTFPFIVWHIHNHDMVEQFTVSNIFEYWTGIVALVFQAWLTFASWGPIRLFNVIGRQSVSYERRVTLNNWDMTETTALCAADLYRSLGYEFFKAAHFFVVMLFMVVFFWHCSGTLTSWHYFVATAAVYIPCWTYPWLRTLFEYGLGQKAQLFVEENGFTRITIPATIKWQPGQHCFLRFRSFGIHALSSHPFTICSLPSMDQDKQSEITFYVRQRGGFTARLYRYALSQPGAQVPILVDGPYGGIDNLKFFESDRLIIVAGGSGAGWMLPFVEQFLRFHALSASRPTLQVPEKQEDGKEIPIEESREVPLRGPKSLRVILATRDISTRSWFHTTITNMIAEYTPLNNPSDLTVEVHITGEAERLTHPASSSSSDLERSTSSSISEGPLKEYTKDAKHHSDDAAGPVGEEARGRPDLPRIIHEEAAAATETETPQNVGVFVCGPLTMQNDVRNAVAQENLRILKNQRRGGMYLHLEHFSWA